MNEGGMSGVYSYKIAILAAKNILGWRGHVGQDAEVGMINSTTGVLDRIYDEATLRSEKAASK